MNSHIVVCECGKRSPEVDWLNALEIQRMHNRLPGHHAEIELVMTK